MKKHNGFFPRKDAEMKIWASVYHSCIKEAGEEVGLSEEQINEQLQAALELSNAIQRVTNLKAELAAAVSYKDEIRSKSEKTIGDLAFYLKRKLRQNPLLYRLGIVGTSQTIVLNEVKPTLKAYPEGQHIRVDFLKKYTYGVAVYSRMRGEDDWQLLSYEKSSPFLDKRPLMNENVPEARQYMIRCTDNFSEIGKFSNIVTAIIG